MQRRLAPSFLPTTAVLELSYACSHSCIYCSCPWERTGGGFEVRKEMPTGRWMAVLRELVDNGVSSLAFTGGEALLREDLPGLLAFAASLEAGSMDTRGEKLVVRRAPPSLYLLTNGRAVDEDLLGLLARLGVKLSVSLPGLDTYREHTGRQGAETVLRVFRMAAEAGVTTTANITVTALNLGELGRIMSAALLAGADQELLNRFLPGGRGLENSRRLQLEPEGIRKMLAVAGKVLQRAGRSGALGTELPRCIADPADHRHLRVSTRCSAARKFFVVGPSGWIRVCNHSERRLLSVEDWNRLLDHPHWVRFAASDYIPQECAGCGMRGVCDGGCREVACVTGGRPDSPDPLLADCVGKPPGLPSGYMDEEGGGR